MTGLVSRLKANAGRLVAIVLVVGVFAFVLPRVANYHEVWEIITGLSTRDMAALVLVALLNLATFAPPWMAAFPGLAFLHALVLSMASTAASSVLPGGDAVGIGLSYAMLRKWGFQVEQVAVGTAATTVWNAFANVIFAVAGVGVLAVVGESHPLLTTAALIGTGALVVAIVLFTLALQDDDNALRVGRLAERLWIASRASFAGHRSRAGISGWSASAAKPSGCCASAGSTSPSPPWRAT